VYARSSTYVGDPSTIDAGIAFVRETVMPMLAEIQPCLGLSFMVDRESGQCIATTSWRFAEDMRDSMEDLTPVRNQLGEILGAQPLVEQWEIAGMHRDHASPEGTCCRVTWFRTDHANVDRGIDVFRMGVMPRLTELPGFCSASLMVDRAASRACATIGYDTAEALAASADQAWAIRDMGIRDAGVDVLDVNEFELVVAHLRVPEMA
jgi:hypothetical protein